MKNELEFLCIWVNSEGKIKRRLLKESLKVAISKQAKSFLSFPITTDDKLKELLQLLDLPMSKLLD